MTKWLECQEKVQLHSTFMTHRQQGHRPRTPSQHNIGPPRVSPQKVRMPRNPKRAQVDFDRLARDYGALDFQDVLAEFIAQINHPGATSGVLQDRAHDTHIPFTRVLVFHKIKFTRGNETDIADAIHARPEQKDVRGRIIPARFDTALVESSKGQVLLTELCTRY